MCLMLVAFYCRCIPILTMWVLPQMLLGRNVGNVYITPHIAGRKKVSRISLYRYSFGLRDAMALKRKKKRGMFHGGEFAYNLCFEEQSLILECGIGMWHFILVEKRCRSHQVLLIFVKGGFASPQVSVSNIIFCVYHL